MNTNDPPYVTEADNLELFDNTARIAPFMGYIAGQQLRRTPGAVGQIPVWFPDGRKSIPEAVVSIGEIERYNQPLPKVAFVAAVQNTQIPIHRLRADQQYVERWIRNVPAFGGRPNLLDQANDPSIHQWQKG